MKNEVEIPAYEADVGVFIGRFQFFHYGHLMAINQALKKVKYLIVLIGSANQPRSYYNPFTYDERVDCISNALLESDKNRVYFAPIEDFPYNNMSWVLEARSAVGDTANFIREYFGSNEAKTIGLVGMKKDGTGFYLDMFPDWLEIPIRQEVPQSATDLRHAYFVEDRILEDKMPPSTYYFLHKFKENKDFKAIKDEYLWVQKFKEPYKALPYPPIFVTVDACVVMSGHILLIQRGDMPGKGLWALPGGYLNEKERIEDAIYRELIEETKIDIPEGMLRGRTTKIQVFDGIYRSSRGRLITHAALIELDNPMQRKSGKRLKLPRVLGSSDAKRAKWFPLRGPGSILPEQCFEDHYAIISFLTADI